MRSLRRTTWVAQPPASLGLTWHAWLTETGSLTTRLQAHCETFRVQRVAQYVGRATLEEAALLGLSALHPVLCREVVLWCDAQPVVCARTLVSPRALQRDWPFFHGLGSRSLGALLFVDPLVQRQPMRYAQLHAAHPLHQFACASVAMQPTQLPARCSVFARQQGYMLVTEIFLPQVLRLRRHKER